MGALSNGQRRRVVLTGVGPVTPVGIGVDRFWSGLQEGRSGVSAIESFDTTDFPCRIAAQVLDFKPEEFMERSELRRMERFSQFAIAASRLALEDAKVEPAHYPSDRWGVVIGSGIGGMVACEPQYKRLLERGPTRVSPFLIPMMIPNMAAGLVAIAFGMTGPNDCTTTACAASAHAIARAVDLIRAGRVDACLAGGSEATIAPLTMAAFAAARALSTRNDEPERASRPFDAGRDGFVIAEGATVLVLEELEAARERGAPVYAEVAGYGVTADAYHETAPLPDGSGAARAMRAALDDAGLPPADIGYINAHGTSTPLGDIAESRAIRAIFGADAPPVSSTKSCTGHLIGAAGSTEVAATALTIRDGVIPPTINLEDPDPECDLDYVPNAARRADVRAAVSNSFAFGGQNATIALARADG
jgi:3-oxoacyl-[acyl-carrier-protein] synthase II